ncbi:tetratricopeptide repeat protein, partial [candidate division KSB1 bacterium]|nr:tetratricopeptide repeat protein [candidate division KSB1 bacterium]
YYNLGELYFNLGNLESASKHLEKTIEIDKNQAHAWGLKGKIKIEEQKYDDAIQSFKEAISLDVGALSVLMWEAYADYLRTEVSIDPGDKRYQEKIVSIIRKLERVERLTEKPGNQHIKAYTLYFLAGFYTKSKDFFTAKEKLKQCLNVESNTSEEARVKEIKARAKELLDYIWNYNIRPPLWRWWLASPLNAWLKRVISCSLFLMLFGCFILYFSNPSWFSAIKESIKADLPFFTYFLTLLVFILLYPGIKYIKTKEFQIEMIAPPPFEFALSPALLEAQITRLGES